VSLRALAVLVRVLHLDEKVLTDVAGLQWLERAARAAHHDRPVTNGQLGVIDHSVSIRRA
jgi:hypothetical protein